MNARAHPDAIGTLFYVLFVVTHTKNPGHLHRRKKQRTHPSRFLTKRKREKSLIFVVFTWYIVSEDIKYRAGDKPAAPTRFWNLARQKTLLNNQTSFLFSLCHTAASVTELKSRLLESLWHRDAVARRSSGRGTEILRQFRRLGTGWAAVTVYETWGDLFFEAYDPVTTSTMTLQVDLCFRAKAMEMDGHGGCGWALCATQFVKGCVGFEDRRFNFSFCIYTNVCAAQCVP